MTNIQAVLSQYSFTVPVIMAIELLGGGC